MNFRRVLPFILFLISLTLLSFTLPSRIQKKVHKEIKKTFSAEDFQLTPIVIDAKINKLLPHKIGADNLFSITKNEEIIGYAFVDKAPSKTDKFDYLILLDKKLIVTKTKILVYREDYGGEIGSRRWLKQFIGKTPSDTLEYEKDIIAISGATISAYAMTNAVNIFLQDLEILHTYKVL